MPTERLPIPELADLDWNAALQELARAKQALFAAEARVRRAYDKVQELRSEEDGNSAEH